MIPIIYPDKPYRNWRNLNSVRYLTEIYIEKHLGFPIADECEDYKSVHDSLLKNENTFYYWWDKLVGKNHENI